MGKIADISKYQGNVDWEKASKDLDFVILRASCGTGKDMKLDANIAGCKQYGIPYHVYHYLKATDFDSAVNEAEVFFQAVNGEEPVSFILDCEYSGIKPGLARELVDDFLFELKQLIGKPVKIGCYIGHHLYSKWNLDYDAFDFIWIPRYGKNSGEPETKPAYPCDLWQYTSKGSLSGVKRNVDLNQLMGEKPMSFFIEQKREDGAETMGYDPKKLIAVAEAEVGYLEKKSNANLDDKTGNAGDKNYTKYARDLDALNFYNGRKNGVAWCDVFVDWCFVQAFGKDAALKLTYQPTNNKNNCGAGCKYSRNYYKQNKRLFDTPEPGDQIFFYPKDGIGGSAIQHTGLVYAVDGTYVYTIEGNTSGANGVVANGGGVCKKKYKLTYNRLAGYGRPVWGENATTPEEPKPAVPNTTAWPAGTKIVEITAKSVNARVGDSTKYGSTGYVQNGETYEWVGTSPTSGWHAIRMPNRICWVSPKYSKVVAV